MKLSGKVFAFLAIAFIGGMGLIVYGCGPEPVDMNITQYNNVPSASFQGEVRDYNTGELLANAEIKVQVRGGWVSTRTDSQGKYNLGGLPACNDLTTYVIRDGYATMKDNWGTACNYDSAGDYPIYYPGITVEDVYLRPDDASLQVNVTRSLNCGTSCTGWTASPISQAGASVSVRLTSVGYDYAQTQDLGSAAYGTFTALPAPITGFVCTDIVKVTPIDCGDGKFLAGYGVTIAGGGGTVALYNGATSTVYVRYTSCVP